MLLDQVRLDLQWMARDFETLLATAPTDRLDEPTDGTRWTNPQLLWHMAFGQHIARVLLPPMSGFPKLPASASRGYANTLSAASRPYDWVNYVGSVAGARMTGLRLARRWMRATPSGFWLGSQGHGRPTCLRHVRASRMGPLLHPVDEPVRRLGLDHEALRPPSCTADPRHCRESAIRVA